MMRSPWQTPLLAAAFACLATAPLTAADASARPRLVRDLYRGTLLEPAEVGLYDLASAGGTTYFSASDPVHGVELWATDGTAAGTRRVTDVCAGRCDGRPGQVAVADGRLFFTADDGFSGRELWTSAGTPGSERPVADLCPGACEASLSPLTVAGGLVFFTAETGGYRRLFRSDGTRRGTFALAALCRLGEEGCEPYNSTSVVAFRDRAFFEAQEPGLAVWVSDGTAAGTRPAADLFGPLVIPYVQSLVPLDGFALVWAADGLWRTDATPAGTVRLRTAAELLAYPDAGVPSIYGQATWRGAVYFSLGGGELVRSDGTAAGTARIATFPDGRLGLDLTPTAGALVMRMSEPAGSTIARELWRSAGTPESTGPLATPPAANGVAVLAAARDRAVFQWLDDFFAPHLGSTDGTVAGTLELDVPGSSDSYRLPSRGGLALYTAHTGIFPGGSEGYGLVLWRSDGTEAGSFALHDFETRPGSGGPLAQIELGGRLLFSGRTSFTEAPLFVSDGTDAGTREISRGGSWAPRFARMGAQAFFPAFDGADVYGSVGLESRGLYKSDGTAAGTGLVARGARFSGNAAVVSGRLFFAGELGFSFGGISDLELFATDGRPGHLPLSVNINPYEDDIGHAHICVGASSSPGPGVEVAGRYVFAADDGWNGRELWESDGTRAGTRLLRDIDSRRDPEAPFGCSGSGADGRHDRGLSSRPEELVAFHGGALFTADDGRTGRELWFTDGTNPGTRRVIDLRPGAVSSTPHDLTPLGDRVYFLATLPAGGEALYQTDGTARGTTLVRDLAFNGTPTWARELTAVGHRLFFTAWNETTGAELWTSRGDAPSTTLVADLRPGPAGAAPQSLTAAGGLLVFAADDGETGLEPWQSDGTAAGTRRLGDLSPGHAASSPGPFTRLGNEVLTGADDGEHGRELWAVPLLR